MLSNNQFVFAILWVGKEHEGGEHFGKWEKYACATVTGLFSKFGFVNVQATLREPDRNEPWRSGEAKTPAHVYGSSSKLSTIFLGASTWANQKAGILGIHKKQLRFQDLCSGWVRQVAIWWADINYSVFQVESWRRGRKKRKTSTESSHKSLSLCPKNLAQPSIYGTWTKLRTEHLSYFIVSIWVVFGL